MEILLHWRNTLEFRKNTAGSIAVIVALSLIPLIVGSGAAVDFGRAYMVKSRLAFALDAAGLAVGSSDPNSDLNGILIRYFSANYPEEQLGTPAKPSMSIADGVIQLSATAEIKTLFLGMIGINEITVAANSVIVRETKGLEIVLVLDNTGSMFFNGKIDALRTAAQDMVDTVFGNEQRPENLTMGLVPFVATVNIGVDKSRFVNFLVDRPTDLDGRANEYPDRIDTSWKGCVEARQFPHDTQDTFKLGDNGKSGEWNPYYWEAEDIFIFQRDNLGNINRNGQVFFSGCSNSWWQPSAFPNTLKDVPRGVYDMRRPASIGQASTPPTFGSLPGQFVNLDITPEGTGGPNKACPDPVVPLTNNRSELEAGIARMKPWFGNGTMANLGAVWGWRLLSPDVPFSQGKPYSDPQNKKVLVILTDGQNLISRNGQFCSRANPKYTSEYTAYGYLGEDVNSHGRLPGITNFNTANRILNERLIETCENIKAKDITVYTIVFQLDDEETLEIFRNCASSPDNFFNSPNNETLRASFRAIGAELSNLRIAQ
jgi:Flp pilus assembly protein TadG